MLKLIRSSNVRPSITLAWVAVLLIGLAPQAALAQTPAAGQIAFASYSVDSDGDGFVTTRDLASIFVVNPDGAGLAQITDGTTLDLEPVWSPQGDRIAFTSRADTNNDGVIDAMNDNAGLVVANADGEDRLALVSDTLNVTLPVWDPTGERIAFVSRRDVNQDGVINSADPAAIYVVDAVGGGLRRLSPEDADAIDPAWSPDGSRLAYSGVADTNGDGIIDKNTGDTASVFAWTMETGAIIQVTDDASSDFDPQWSPDGARIAFVSFRRDDNGDGLITTADVPSVTVIDADGGNRRQLTDDEFIDLEPRWSPDGGLIAFRSYRIDSDGDGLVTMNDRPGVYKINAQGGNLVLLSDSAGSAERPVWSPDGSGLAYHGAIDANGDGAINAADPTSIFVSDATITDAKDRQIVQVTAATAIDFQPTWLHPSPAAPAVAAAPAQQAAATPTQEEVEEAPTLMPAIAQPTAIPTSTPVHQPGGPVRLVYLSRSADTSGDGFIDARDNKSLITIDADGGNPVQITGIDSDDSNPVWSPDAQWVAYVARTDTNGDGLIRQDDYQGVFVVAADGSSINRLTPQNMLALGPSWSPDSQRLVFYGTSNDSDGDGLFTTRDNTNIYLVNRDGSGMVQLTLDPTSDFGPDWSPDGTKIAFAARTIDTSGDEVISIFDNASIFVVGVDGTNLTQITVNATEDQAPRWSPTGQHLAFVSWTADSNQDGFISVDLDIPGVFVIEPTGANLTRLTEPGTYAQYPAWSSDGTRIAYVVRQDSDGDGAFSLNDAGYLFVIDYAGNVRAQLTDDTAGTLLPSWKPDGQLIAFHSWRDVNEDGVINFPDTPSIYTITVDGATRTQITDSAYADFNPVWAPQ
jgi:Tol biopolymer transport system component